jgi:hypothetical protein
MKKLSVVAVAAAIAFGATLPVAAQTSTVVTKAPGAVTTVQRIKAVATVVAIDSATRAVTLKGPDGRETTVIAGPEVKNFAQIKVSDRVNVEYTEALTLELKKGITEPRARAESSMAEAAKAGERPGAVAGRKVTVMAEVIGLDAATQTVTLRGPKQTVNLKVADPEQFKRVAMGDRVEATYVEAVAVVVTPAR